MSWQHCRFGPLLLCSACRGCFCWCRCICCCCCCCCWYQNFTIFLGHIRRRLFSKLLLFYLPCMLHGLCLLSLLRYICCCLHAVLRLLQLLLLLLLLALWLVPINKCEGIILLFLRQSNNLKKVRAARFEPLFPRGQNVGKSVLVRKEAAAQILPPRVKQHLVQRMDQGYTEGSSCLLQIIRCYYVHYHTN